MHCEIGGTKGPRRSVWVHKACGAECTDVSEWRRRTYDLTMYNNMNYLVLIHYEAEICKPFSIESTLITGSQIVVLNNSCVPRGRERRQGFTYDRQAIIVGNNRKLYHWLIEWSGLMFSTQKGHIGQSPKLLKIAIWTRQICGIW